MTVAVGHGKKAARHIDAWLRGRMLSAGGKAPAGELHMLHLPVYSDADPAAQRTLASPSA